MRPWTAFTIGPSRTTRPCSRDDTRPMMRDLPLIGCRFGSTTPMKVGPIRARTRTEKAIHASSSSPAAWFLRSKGGARL